MTDVALKHSAWFGDKDFKIDFPQEWDVVVHSPIRVEKLTKEKVSAKINNFIESLDLKKVGANAKLALIVDDISRPTPVSHIISVLLGKLIRIGIKKNNIFIITAGGSHEKMKEDELRKKLGDKVVNTYKVMAHDMKRQLYYYGKTRRGTPIFINSLIRECDLKIGIGGVYPHSPSGFGGGAKILLGVSGFKTIACMHYNLVGTELGGELENDFRKDLEEIARIVKFNSTINIVINDERQVAEIFAGNIIDSHRKAVEFVRSLYYAPAPLEADIVIANTYPFDTTFLYSKKGWWPISGSPKETTNIVIGALPLGLGNHGIHPIAKNNIFYFFKKLVIISKLSPGKIFDVILKKLTKVIMKKNSRNGSPIKIIYFRPEEITAIDFSKGLEIYTSWDMIHTLLLKRYLNCRPKVAVYSCSSIQYPQIIS